MDLKKIFERSTTVLLAALISLFATVYAVSYANGVEAPEVVDSANVPAAIVVTEAPANTAVAPAAIVVTETPANTATTPAAIIVR